MTPNFEYIPSGLKELDKKLDHIRPGDNVVFRVQKPDNFDFFCKAFVRQSVIDGRNLHYIRFGRAESLLGDDGDEEEYIGVNIHTLNPNVGFEKFTIAVHHIIREAGQGALFLFDCLTGLQESWHTDAMMCNFIRVTCPCLTQYGDAAFFYMIRGVHSYDATAGIRETVQIFLDVYDADTSYYLIPLKVENRYHADMYLAHRIDADGSFHPMTYSTSVSRYFSVIEQAGAGEQMQDSWVDFFSRMRILYANGSMKEAELKKMAEVLTTRDKKIRKKILKHFNPRDYFQIQTRMIGTGMIGGKACGMLLARKIVRTYCPQAAGRFEPHDSYYVGSDIYYTYIIHNDCWPLWMELQSDPDNTKLARKLHDRFLQGSFPDDIRSQFKRMLDYFGTSPIIVRSSSLLEDGFGNAFAGKYESVFCVNNQSLEERMQVFEDAIRVVYASTMSPSAIEYRKIRGLWDKEEQMALLVQRVSGSRLDGYYLPMAAGVGYSYNGYPWSDEIDPKAGMLRLVAGLGTRAVDRTPGDYPRLVSLDKPKLTAHTSIADRHKFSQHRMDVLDLKENKLDNRPVEEMYPYFLSWQRKQIFSNDYEVERMLRERGENRQVVFADCDRLVSNQEFTNCMKMILDTLQQHYEAPVDIEYTVNMAENGEFQINLLQCRLLQSSAGGKVMLPDYRKEDTLFHIRRNVLGTSRRETVDAVVYIDPYAYYSWPYAEKAQVARAVGVINRHFAGTGKHLLLITPGRIGTSSPELGVPVSYAEISHFREIMEVAYSEVGYMPELSFGSHMFQDLVEADILYAACMEHGDTVLYQPKLLEAYENISSRWIPESLRQVIAVYDTEGSGLELAFDIEKREIICGRNDAWT